MMLQSTSYICNANTQSQPQLTCHTHTHSHACMHAHTQVCTHDAMVAACCNGVAVCWQWVGAHVCKWVWGRYNSYWDDLRIQSLITRQDLDEKSIDKRIFITGVAMKIAAPPGIPEVNITLALKKMDGQQSRLENGKFVSSTIPVSGNAVRRSVLIQTNTIFRNNWKWLGIQDSYVLYLCFCGQLLLPSVVAMCKCLACIFLIGSN